MDQVSAALPQNHRRIFVATLMSSVQHPASVQLHVTVLGIEHENNTELFVVNVKSGQIRAFPSIPTNEKMRKQFVSLPFSCIMTFWTSCFTWHYWPKTGTKQRKHENKNKLIEWLSRLEVEHSNAFNFNVKP